MKRLYYPDMVTVNWDMDRISLFWVRRCSMFVWLVAGADLFWEKSIAGWFVLREKYLALGMKVVRILSVRPTGRPTERVRHSNSKTVFKSGHLISVTICTALVSGNSMLNFYDPNMMNTTIRQKIYCMYSYSIREFFWERKIICICIRSIRSYPICFHP
jgi:hypothetical protein